MSGLYGLPEIVVREFKPCTGCSLLWAPDKGLFDAIFRPCEECGNQLDRLVLEAEAVEEYLQEAIL